MGCVYYFVLENLKPLEQFTAHEKLFTVRISTKLHKLEKGVTETHHVADNDFVYFDIYIPLEDTEILITLTSLDHSDPNLYVMF